MQCSMSEKGDNHGHVTVVTDYAMSCTNVNCNF